MRISIAHIVPNEKFIDTAIKIFDSLQNVDNTYFCIASEPIKYIKSKDRLSVRTKAESVIKEINQSNYQIVILHSLFISCKMLNKLDFKFKIIWLSWGYDIYYQGIIPFFSYSLLKKKIYMPLTLKYLSRPRSLARELLSGFKGVVVGRRKETINFYKRVDFLSTVLPVEYELILKDNDFGFKYFYFRYKSGLFEYHKQEKVSGENILLGNSAAITNNHLDVLNILKNLNLGERKIILPLSYSGNKSYIGELKTFINKNGLGNNVIYLENFLEYKDYQSLLSSCSIAIFGHIRQQAMGNIHMMLGKGAKLFLYTNSIAYLYLLEKGYSVYPLENLTNKTLEEKIPLEKVNNNIKMLEKDFNYVDFINQLELNIYNIVEI